MSINNVKSISGIRPPMHPYLPATAPSQYPYSMLSGHDQLAAAAWQHQAASMYHAGLRASSPYGLPITSAGLPRYFFNFITLQQYNLFNGFFVSFPKKLSHLLLYLIAPCHGFHRPVYLVIRVFHKQPLLRQQRVTIIYLKLNKN